MAPPSSEPLVHATGLSALCRDGVGGRRGQWVPGGFVTQASINPVRFIVCVSKVNHTFGVA